MSQGPQTTLPACVWCGASRAEQSVWQSFYTSDGDPLCAVCWDAEYGDEYRERRAARCPQCGRIGMDDCEASSCVWEQWADGTPVTGKQKADGAAWAEGVNAWLAKREAGRG